ncbi:hypothetical protein Tco_0711090, partial [Tanacetum coccineum]
IDEKNVKESIPIPKEEVVSEPQWINVKESVLPTRNVFPILDIMRGTEYTPNEYVLLSCDEGCYYANEVNQFVESLHGEVMDTLNRIIPEDSFYDIYGIKTDFTGDSRKLVIPKKKSMGIETIAGNIIFFC